MMQEFSQELEDTIQSMLNEIHTALPGKIISVDEEDGTATVRPVGKFVTSDGIELDYPDITEAPLVFPFCQSEKVGMAFPVEKGDSCIIIISEVELDEWRSGAESEGSLRFDLTSAMILPGLLKKGNNLMTKAIKKNAVVIGSSDTEIAVSKDGVAVRGNLNVEGNIFYTETCQRV